jgi:murein L,D-transpeptidase YafK
MYHFIFSLVYFLMSKGIILLLFLNFIGLVYASSYSITVKKADRKLFLYKDKELVRTYTIALGLQPVGMKTKQGDYKTPEGTYYICQKNDKSQFYLSLMISYPNATDAERGLKDKRISKATYTTIKNAETAKRKPPMNTKLGGDICIHGNGTNSDWTWGCVAMEDKDVKELFDMLPLKTAVTIKP